LAGDFVIVTQAFNDSSKISDLRSIFMRIIRTVLNRRKEYIIWLDISVNHLHRIMQVVKTLDHSFKDE